MEKRELYAYTFPNYLRDGDVECLIKVGDSEVGRWEERISEQMGTATPEQPIKILIGTLPSGVRDHKIHSQLIKNGSVRKLDGKGKEWFTAKDKKDPFREVRRAYNEIVNNTSRTENFTLRKEQQQAIDKAKRWFGGCYSKEILESATHKNRFLINAKMRFGKCFTSISLAKEISARNTLIVTYKPDVIGEWIDTVNEQVTLDGWMGIRARSKSDRPSDPCLSSDGEFPRHGGPIVLCVSLQDLDIDLEGNTKERLHKIPEIKWDLVIFDEVHYGSRTPRAKQIIEKLKFDYRLDLSGTPFRLIVTFPQ